VAASFVLWKWVSEGYLKKTHIARASAAGGNTTDCARDNDTAESVGTLCVADDCAVDPLKYLRKGGGSC